MQVRTSGHAAVLLVAWSAALCTTIACRGAPPECAPGRPPAKVPPELYRALAMGPEPAAADGLRAQLRALLTTAEPSSGSGWDSDCEQTRNDSGAAAGLIRHALADGSRLIEVTCAQGAYQGSFCATQLWSSPAGGPAVAVAVCWPVPSEPAHGSEPAVRLSDEVVVWGELESVAAAAGRLATAEIVNRFRAIGDCGTRSRHTIERGTTRLVGLAAAGSCPEAPAAAPAVPAAWPRAKVPDR